MQKQDHPNANKSINLLTEKNVESLLKCAEGLGENPKVCKTCDIFKGCKIKKND